jgi:predicted DNA-binding transcriptional regulator AlpA
MPKSHLPSSANFDGTHLPRMEPLLVRIREVVALVGAHRSTVIRWVALGEFPAPVRLPGRRVAWRLADVVAWAEARESVAR